MVMSREPEMQPLKGWEGAEFGAAGHEAGHLDLSELDLDLAEPVRKKGDEGFSIFFFLILKLNGGGIFVILKK